MPGSIRSRTTRSGRVDSTSSTPLGPSAAMATVKPSLRSRAATDAAMSASSSMMTIDTAVPSVATARSYWWAEPPTGEGNPRSARISREDKGAGAARVDPAGTRERLRW